MRSLLLEVNRLKDRQAEAELVAAGGFGQSGERGIQGLWSRIADDIQADKEQYRFA